MRKIVKCKIRCNKLPMYSVKICDIGFTNYNVGFFQYAWGAAEGCFLRALNV